MAKRKSSLGDLVLQADEADHRFDGGAILPPERQLQTRDDFVAAISALWRAAQENFIAIGRRLVEAKMQLPHGEYEAMVAADMPFDTSMARRLRTVAEAIDTGQAPVAHLPASPTIIYEVITTTTDRERQAGIEAGVISPKMKRDDFRAWIKQIRSPAVAEDPATAVESCAGAHFDEVKVTRRHEEIAAGVNTLAKPLSVDPRIRLEALRARRAALTAEITAVDAEIAEIEKALGDDAQEVSPVQRKLRLIAHIIAATWTTHAKWRVEIAMVDGPKLVAWMTEKQHQKLVKCFERTNNGNSTKNCQVYGVFDGDRFIWCGTHTRRHSDIAFLRDKFGAVGEIVWSLEERDGPIPLPPAASTEPDDDLIDD